MADLLSYVAGGQLYIIDMKDKSEWEIGGNTGNPLPDIAVASPRIESHHGKFIYAEDHWFYFDQLGTQGTVLNGKVIMPGIAGEVKPIPLANGDVFYFGLNDAGYVDQDTVIVVVLLNQHNTYWRAVDTTGETESFQVAVETEDKPGQRYRMKFVEENGKTYAIEEPIDEEEEKRKQEESDKLHEEIENIKKKIVLEEERKRKWWEMFFHRMRYILWGVLSVSMILFLLGKSFGTVGEIHEIRLWPASLNWLITTVLLAAATALVFHRERVQDLYFYVSLFGGYVCCGLIFIIELGLMIMHCFRVEVPAVLLEPRWFLVAVIWGSVFIIRSWL